MSKSMYYDAAKVILTGVYSRFAQGEQAVKVPALHSGMSYSCWIYRQTLREIKWYEPSDALASVAMSVTIGQDGSIYVKPKRSKGKRNAPPPLEYDDIGKVVQTLQEEERRTYTFNLGIITDEQRDRFVEQMAPYFNYTATTEVLETRSNGAKGFRFTFIPAIDKEES